MVYLGINSAFVRFTTERDIHYCSCTCFDFGRFKAIYLMFRLQIIKTKCTFTSVYIRFQNDKSLVTLTIYSTKRISLVQPFSSTPDVLGPFFDIHEENQIS
jgi:hypothetical protein